MGPPSSQSAGFLNKALHLSPITCLLIYRPVVHPVSSKSLDLVMEVHGLFSLFSCPAVFSFPAYYSRFFGPSCVDRRQQRGEVRELAGGDNHNNPSTFSSKTFSMKLLDCPSFCFVIFLMWGRDFKVFVDELDVSFEVYHFLEGKTTCIWCFIQKPQFNKLL